MAIEQPNAMDIAAHERKYDLHFESVLDGGSTYAFPCDAQGNVDLDVLSSSALNDYLFARVLLGHQFSIPFVRPSTNQSAS